MKKHNDVTQAGQLRRSCVNWLQSLLIVSMLLFQSNALMAQSQPTPPHVAKVTLSLKDATMSELFQDIQKQTGLSVVYNASRVNMDKKVTVTANNESVNTVLDRVLAGAEFSYTINDKHIVLANKAAANQRDAKQAVTGRVADSKGVPLLGATVVVVGTTTGVVTDVNGNFSVPVAIGSALEVSYAGYNKKTVSVASYTPLRIALEEDNVMVDEVVVTALGIKRETKALTYNVQEVGGSAVTTVKDASFVNSLAGKIAGVQINSSASGIGGSTRVVMRGTKSLFGDNNALYVVDGIPLSNFRTEQSAGFYETPDGGDGDGISNLNPEDIESMSVLTGAAAAALYGSQGANGVIVITTKKGAKDGLKVNYSNNTTFMSPFVTPKFQNTYGSERDTYESWGDKLKSPSSYDPLDFFQTGYNVQNSVSVSSGTERSQTYISVSSLNSRGIIPNNKFNRYNFNFRNTTELIKDKLTIDLSASYVRQDDRNMLVQGQYHNPLIPIYLFPRSGDIEKYKLYERQNSNYDYKTQYWPHSDLGMGSENPWWIVNRELFENLKNRYIFTASMKYDILDCLNVTGRVRSDNYQNTFTRKIYASSDTKYASVNGNYLNHKRNDNNLYADAIINFDKTICDFSLTANVGASLVDVVHNLTGYEGHLVAIPNLFSYDNIDRNHAQSIPEQDRFHDQTQAVFATAQVGFKGFLFLDLTARNEWSTQLAYTKKNNFFYPSIGFSAVISQMTDLSGAGISFLKLRGSYSEVGNAPLRYITRESYKIVNGSVQTQTFKPNTDLAPERTKAYEVGLNAKFLNNKINLDVTYYNTNTYNQIFNIEMPPASGYTSAYINSGKVNNWGIEASLGYKNRFGDFNWNSNLTFTLNRNKINELVSADASTDFGQLTEYVVGTVGGYQMLLKNGGTMNDVYVNTLLVDDNGFVRVDPNTGTVKADNTGKRILAGSVAPKANLGWNNTFQYKNFELGVLIDARLGGIVVSSTQAIMDRFGASKASADARDAGGALVNGGRINAQSYYAIAGGNQTGVLSEYVYSATNVRLRELSLGYTLPAKWFNDKIDALTLSLVGRNLFMFYNKAPFDPELTASTGTYYQGYDYFMQPSMRTMGFSVRIQF